MREPNKTRCVVIDDEPPARELIVSYISRLDEFTVVSQFDNAIDAFAFLQKNSVDLIFLDIQMPGMTGLELVESLHHPPQVVLTTAYREYATDGFDLNVLDYLVKPIAFTRFMKSIAKYHHYISRPDEKQLPANDPFDQAYFFIKVNKDQVKVFFKDILYIESIKDYLKIITTQKTYITYDRMMYMEEKLPEGRFVRIHKSYIISLDKVTAFRTDSVTIAGKVLPVGRVYKQKFVETFRQ